MDLDADDLRVRLGFSEDDWTADDTVRAQAVLASAYAVILTFAGPEAVEYASTVADEPKLAAVDEATLTYAVALFANPERALQRRHGPDVSVSFADATGAATGLQEARQILAAAGFGKPPAGAWSYDTVQQGQSAHSPTCRMAFGSDVCDCGVLIAGRPIFEVG